MGQSTYFTRNGHVYMADGPWEARLEPRQCDQLLGIFDEANAVTHFNALWEAMDAAGLCPSTFGRPRLQLVSDKSAQDVVRDMLTRSVSTIHDEPHGAA